MRCPDCGQFMRHTNLILDEDWFDDDLAREHGLDPDECDWDSPKWQVYFYVYEHWECVSCPSTFVADERVKYYYKPKSNTYTETPPPKPLTETEKIARYNRKQEEAGQLVLFDGL